MRKIIEWITGAAIAVALASGMTWLILTAAVDEQAIREKAGLEVKR